MPETRVDIATDRPPPLELRRAILLYSQGRNDHGFATIHDCAVIAGKPVILAGRAMSPAMSRAIAAKLGTARMQGGFLPANVLMVDGEHLVWHEPPMMRHLAFKASTQFPERSLGTGAGKAPTPGTIFVAGPGAWAVFAYKGTQRPTPDTPLFQAPFYNVDKQGSICVGNVKAPNSTTAERITAWNDAFFRTYFAHANYDGVVDYAGDVTGLWRDLLDGKHRDAFPEQVLMPHRWTLADLLHQLGGKR
jgi:PRTRC genetic system protein B